jgi:uncharacterized protein
MDSNLLPGKDHVAENPDYNLRVVVGQLFQIVDSKDWDALPGVLADDLIYERPGYAPLVGLEQVLHFYRAVRVIDSGEHQLDKIVTANLCGACWGRFVGQRKDGAPVDERFADTYIFEKGKIRRRYTYFFRPAV